MTQTHQHRPITQWQPIQCDDRHQYIPPAVDRPLIDSNKSGKAKTISSKWMAGAVRERLQKGPARRDELFKILGCTDPQWARMMDELRGEMRKEAVGYKVGKYWLYWLDCAPPDPSERSQVYRLLEFIKAHPWSAKDEIPDDVFLGANRANYMPMLVLNGTLEFRLRAGVKQFRLREKA